jgi:nucleoid-associated protein Lsr2
MGTENEMAQKVNVFLVDDIDGSNAGETIPFGLDGTHYEIDLNSEHAHELRRQLERYVRVARKVTGPASRPAQARRTNAAGARNKEVRSWARERGLDVSDRGRIPADIIAQYEEENGR